MKIFDIFRGNLWFKFVALILAIVTYSYVWEEIGNRHMGVVEREVLRKITSKVIPVRIVLKGEPPPGYRILKENVNVEPEKIIIIGKKEDLAKISEVSTLPIDVRKFTHTQVIYTPLVPIENAINISSRMVKVEIPLISR